MPIDLKEQFLTSTRLYVQPLRGTIPDTEIAERAAAFLSGCALTARFLNANDGHAEINSSTVEKAVLEAGKELGFGCEPLKDREQRLKEGGQ